MSGSMRVPSRWITMLAVCFMTQMAFGIVLHPGEGEPEAENWIDKPADEVIGRWANNASCVAISPNCVITTRHQGGENGIVVHIAGTSYRVEAVWNHPDRPNPDDDDYREVDLRIAKLAGANLRQYAGLFTTGREVDKGKSAAIGGYGLGRGAELRKSGVTYGYAWEDPAVYKNLQLRWCTNSIDYIWLNVQAYNPQTGSLNNNDFVIADFDDPATTRAEGAVAGYDSGGGWFVRMDDGWQLAGLTWGADHAQSMEARFRSSINPTIASPDRMYALHIGSYADWIEQILAGVCTPPDGDINGDCKVDMHDVAGIAAQWLRQDCTGANSFCKGADIDSSGRVDADDLSRLQHCYPETPD